jgi:negative regulator of flagellin synthesis FlgM
MKINEALKSVGGLGKEKLEANEKKSAKASGATAQTEAKSGENVTLSPLSEKIKSLETKVAAEGVFDSNKVESIKSAISSGTFKVDTEKVADGLMQTVKDLISR